MSRNAFDSARYRSRSLDPTCTGNATMSRSNWMAAGALLAAAMIFGASAARADFEVTGPDGRRILLKDDGTWRYVDAAAKEQKKKDGEATGDAVLTLLYRKESGPNCRFGLRLANNLPYEIDNIVPTFSVFRADGVLYETKGRGFFSVKPGNSQDREVEFRGITCNEIKRLQVGGGDRCGMGELTRFSAQSGECLARVRVVASDILRFDK